MRIVDFSVTCRKQVSDSNYGTESAEVHLSGVLETSDEPEVNDQVEWLLGMASDAVLDQLRRSLSPAVRRAVEDTTRARPPSPAAVPETIQRYVEERVDSPEELPF
jgi:hypothetical protein